jgi:hypothetical protein
MSSRRRVKTRTQRCDAAQARKRLADARLFLELAETVDEAGGPEWLSVSAANAVHAGIAAADAACCRALGERSRRPSRRHEAGGSGAARRGGSSKALGRLLGLKNDA